jgi:hypothetical protein
MTMRLPEIPSLDVLGADAKQCCADLYETEAVRWLLGDELHPGGDRLSRRLAELARLRAGERVLDVAGGPGRTARLLSSDFDVDVVAIDLGAGAVERAQREAVAAGLSDRVTAVRGDAEALPFDDGTFDVAWSECSLCTFPDKARAVAEMVRVLRPGGRIAIADVTADLAALPAPLRTAAAAVACVGEARAEEEYVALLHAAGAEVPVQERHDAELLAMIDRVEARLRVARMLTPPGEQRERVREAVALTRLAREQIERGSLGYVLLVASRGSTTV